MPLMQKPFIHPCLRLLVALWSLVLFGGVALANPFQATLNFADGLVPGREALVIAQFSSDTPIDLQGAEAVLVLQGGQDGASFEVALGKVQVGNDLRAKVTPDVAGLYRVSVKFSRDGRNYASTGEMMVPNPGSKLDLIFDGARTTSYNPPFLQYVLFFMAAVALGLVALRGGKAF
jgi:hypothetical protein